MLQQAVPSPDDAFTDAWRSSRIAAGDDAALLPDPLGALRKRVAAPFEDDNSSLPERQDQGGGFLIELETTDAASSSKYSTAAIAAIPSPSHLPLSFVADALATLQLPTDQGVLAVFRTAAVAPPSGARRPRPGQETPERVITRQTWNEVVTVLAERRQAAPLPSANNDDDEAENLLSSRRRRRRSRAPTNVVVEDDDEDDDSHDAFVGEDNEDDDSASDAPASSASDHARQTSRTSRSRKVESFDATQEVEIDEDQRQFVLETWELLTDKVGVARSARIGRAQVAAVIKSLGEKMNDAEIDEMLSEGSKLWATVTSAKRPTSRTTGAETLGINEFAGVLLKARMI